MNIDKGTQRSNLASQTTWAPREQPPASLQLPPLSLGDDEESTIRNSSEDTMTENISHHAPNSHRGQTHERAEAMGPDLVQLTQRITANSNIIGGNASALAPRSGSELDPYSPIFDAVAWVKAFMALIQSDAEAPPTRKSGVSFRDLSAFGYSLGSDYQKDVGNVWLSLLSSIRSLVGMNSSRRRIDILRDLEGLVEDGEMCIVLGPPGSGCSTFLRTISGEADGVSISPDSSLNFQGMQDILSLQLFLQSQR